MHSFVLKIQIGPGASGTVADYLAARSGLSKSRIKDAMNKGAVLVRRKDRGKLLRMRRATAPLSSGDYVEFHYDEKVLSVRPPQAECISDQGKYSVWFKPAGLMAQGTAYGDHCSLLRQAEVFFGSSRQIYPVHRLDREASGIVLIAHSSEAAANLSELFRDNMIVKKYRVEVLGDLAARGREGRIELPLDGKEAVTEYEVRSYYAESNRSEVDVIIRTGRLHQIRRHFDMIGFPVIGDPKYGRGNKNSEGMKLTALSLRFRCPFTRRDVEYTIPDK